MARWCLGARAGSIQGRGRKEEHGNEKDSLVAISRHSIVTVAVLVLLVQAAWASALAAAAAQRTIGRGGVPPILKNSTTLSMKVAALPIAAIALWRASPAASELATVAAG